MASRKTTSTGTATNSRQAAIRVPLPSNSASPPELASTGEPDLIILNSVYWDLRYFSRKARHEGWSSGELQDSVRPLSWNELRWYRHRLGVMVELFRERFPGVPLMYRTGAGRRLFFLP